MAWKNKVKKTLLNYYSSNRIEEALKNYIPTQCQNIAPDLGDTDVHSQKFVAKQSLNSFFLDREWETHHLPSSSNIYMILGESGMGKTTFMINLYARFLKKFKNLPWRVKLIPLGLPNVLQDIEQLNLEEKKYTVLLLDAFDEDSEALQNHKERLAEILSLVKDFPEVIITCRTQFFPSKEEEPTGEQGSLIFQYNQKSHALRKLYISPFDIQDVRNYLIKNYSFFLRRNRKKAETMIERFPSLLIRPMLLKYLEDLIDRNKDYKYNYEVYDAIVEKWINREILSSNSQYPEQHFKDLMEFSTKIAMNMYEHHNHRKGFFVGSTRFQYFKQTFNLSLDENILRSRSLLSRNATGQYHFSHQSIFEYFLALEAYRNPEFAKKIERENLKDTHMFLEERYISNSFKIEGKFKTAYNRDWQNLSHIQPLEIILVKEIMTEDKIEDFRYFRGFRNLKVLQVGDKVLKDEELRQWLHFSNRTSEIKQIPIHLEQPNNFMLAS